VKLNLVINSRGKLVDRLRMSADILVDGKVVGRCYPVLPNLRLDKARTITIVRDWKVIDESL
jgi:hypothetical protein